MATYKAEFLSHYYEGRVRPRHAYTMGWIYWWARLASWAPGIANFFSQTPLLRDLAKWLGGIAPERRLPRFARQTFKDWFRLRRPRVHSENPPVILWPDTFSNFFHPDIGQASVEVLESAGYQVWIPEKSLCCGRPLYDFGMLDAAKLPILEHHHEFGDYELRNVLGSGGMGVVYRAWQRSLGIFVALKVIRVGHLASGGEVKRFRDEAK
jgi:hypothetical protein